MDVNANVVAIKSRLNRVSSFVQGIDWMNWLKVAGTILLGLFAISILAFIFLGIPALVFISFVGFLKTGYHYIVALEEKYYYAVGFLIISVFILLLYRRMGLVSLSSQSLAHRRNLFFSFFLVFLIENFNLDVSGMLKAKNPDIDAASKGILSFFALYSFIEYAHNFMFDYLRSKNESKISDNNSFFRFPKLVDPWLIFVGNYRVIFDVIFPITSCLFILIIYQSDIKTFYRISETYVTTQVNDYLDDPKNEKSKKLVEYSLLEYENSKTHLTEVFNEAEEISVKVYKGVESEFKKQKVNEKGS